MGHSGRAEQSPDPHLWLPVDGRLAKESGLPRAAVAKIGFLLSTFKQEPLDRTCPLEKAGLGEIRTER